MRRLALVTLLLGVVLLASCAGGPGSDWSKPGADPAGFWAGLWHGALMLVTLIVSFFTDQVRIYEAQNTGIAYDIAFVLGALAVYGGSASAGCRKKRGFHIEIGGKGKDKATEDLERKIKSKLESWLDDEEDWKDLGERFERKIKGKIRNWLAEEDGEPGNS